jgi:hypothetical protein
MQGAVLGSIDQKKPFTAKGSEIAQTTPTRRGWSKWSTAYRAAPREKTRERVHDQGRRCGAEAEEALRKALAIEPAWFDPLGGRHAPWRRPEYFAHLLEGLRKAGWREG